MHSIQTAEGISLSAISIVGTRSEQQDYYVSSQHGKRTIAVVCDGMGGLEGGEMASRKAAEMLLEDMERLPSIANIHSFYERELLRLDNAVFMLKKQDGTRMNGGTTLASVLIEDNMLNWFSVGDSKLFYKRSSDMYCVTREHNYALRLNEMKRSKEITTLQLNAEMSKGEHLISYLGMGSAELFDGNYRPFAMKKDDRILLCTDGLYKTLSKEDIYTILSQRGSTDRICKLFENAILSKNKMNQDNATFIVIQKTDE